MNKEDRREAIAEIVLSKRRVLAADLADLFDVSLITIHRDLDDLADEGLLSRFHGGASAMRDSLFEPDINYRLRIASQAKNEIASAALKFVEPNSSLLLDDSTTVCALARLLPKVGPVTVATSFLEIQMILKEISSVRLVGLGGDYSAQTNSFGGAGLLSALEGIRVNTLFASVSALDSQGIFHQEPGVVTTKRAMMAIATKKYLLVDSSKLGHSALYRVSSLAAWDAIVVDSKADPSLVSTLQAGGGNIIVAAVTP